MFGLTQLSIYSAVRAINSCPMYIVLSLAIYSLGFANVKSENCIPRDYGNGGTVCVCNAEQCDILAPVIAVEEGRYLIYTSNQAGLRFNSESGSFITTSTPSRNIIKVNQRLTYQEILGWGGAFTDATGININSLSLAARKNLLRSYFGEDGLEYSLCRVPIGGTDFSTHAYSYLNESKSDPELKTFSLQDEDYQLKIPLIEEALDLTNNKLKLVASAWVVPEFMRTRETKPGGLSFLKTEMYQPWANYYMKFLESYLRKNISFWGITVGNDQSLIFAPQLIPSIAWTTDQLITWIKENLGPTLRHSTFSNINLIALDDPIFFLPWNIYLLLEDPSVQYYVDGVAVNWHNDRSIPAPPLTLTHDLYPEKFLLSIEAHEGDVDNESVLLGSWSRGEEFIYNIIQTINKWTSGWITWNMALDLTGGPSYIGSNVDSPIIVNTTGDEFYKQPMYYALGHFSKFVPRGSLKIYCTQFADDVPTTAFKRPDGSTAVIILNQFTIGYNHGLYIYLCYTNYAT